MAGLLSAAAPRAANFAAAGEWTRVAQRFGVNKGERKAGEKKANERASRDTGTQAHRHTGTQAHRHTGTQEKPNDAHSPVLAPSIFQQRACCVRGREGS